MMFAESVTFPAAFIAGLLSFFSPCILPLIPAYFTFITGLSLDELTHSDLKNTRKQIVLSTLSYVLGFTVVFIIMGASATFFGSLLQENKGILRIAGGVIILLLGLHLTGLLRLKFLDFDKRLHVEKKPVHIFGTFLVGMAFGAGWSPCVGPLLGSILIVAGNQETVNQGILLLATYSLGLAIPFLIISFSISSMLSILNKTKWVLRYVNVAAGIVLIFAGGLLIANRLSFFV